MILGWFKKFVKGCSKPKSVVSDSMEECDPPSVVTYLEGHYPSVVFDMMSFAEKSILTGKYMMNGEWYEKEMEIFANCGRGRIKRYEKISFANVFKAFLDLERSGEYSEDEMILVCRNIVVMFNSMYSENCWSRERNFALDYHKFFIVVNYMLRFNLNVLVKAELYRQISMFKKCVELLNNAYYKITDELELEIRDEILYRACNGIRYPFMIYDVGHLQEAYEKKNTFKLNWFFNVKIRIDFGN